MVNYMAIEQHKQYLHLNLIVDERKFATFFRICNNQQR